MLKAIFFDLDGSLLPLDEQEFTKVYFDLISDYMQQYGYDKEKLINVILEGTKRMYKNNGQKTNEEVFWEYFEGEYGSKKLQDKVYFNEFYENGFKKTKKCCCENSLAKDIVDYAKDKNLHLILSTNPIFPRIATLQRMNYIGLKQEDFDYITTYENSSYTKPNPKYFESLLSMFNLKPEEVVVFGNNDLEDYLCAKQANIDCYLINNNLIIHDNLNLKINPITMNDVISTIEFEIEERK